MVSVLKIFVGLIMALIGVVLVVGWFDSFVQLVKGALGPFLVLVGVFFLIVGFTE